MIGRHQLHFIHGLMQIYFADDFDLDDFSIKKKKKKKKTFDMDTMDDALAVSIPTGHIQARLGPDWWVTIKTLLLIVQIQMVLKVQGAVLACVMLAKWYSVVNAS